jgi:hypothetical protein
VLDGRRAPARVRESEGGGVTAQLIDLPADEYFALDAFSQSAAKTLIRQSPAHARAGYRKPPSKAMERGDIIGRLLLGRGKDYEIIHAANFMTKDAKAKRDAAREQGLVPVLAHDFENYCLAAESIRVQLADRNIILDGLSEQQIAWTEHTEFGDVACKGMFDHVWPETGVVIDLKTTADASPSAVERTAENLGYAIQCAAYTRALTALDPGLAGRIAFAFVWAETDEPYAVNVTEPDGVFCELGERRWLRAVREWARCIRDNNWPGYGPAVNPITAPTWALTREGYTADER